MRVVVGRVGVRVRVVVIMMVVVNVKVEANTYAATPPHHLTNLHKPLNPKP